MIRTPTLWFVALLGLVTISVPAAEPRRAVYRVRLTVTSMLPEDVGYIPMDPEIDFDRLIKQAGLTGVLNPASIEVTDVATGAVVPHALEDFEFGSKGRVEWLIKDPTHKVYEINFKTAARRLHLELAKYTPMIGVGDALRYNAGTPRPILYPYVPFD